MRILLSILLASSALLQGNTGSISGVVPIPATKASSVSMEKYRGKISGKVAPRPSTIAAVWLTSPTLSAPAKPKPVILAQKNYQFSKSLIVISKGTTVTFPNNDPDYHNIYSLSKTKHFDLGRYSNPLEVLPLTIISLEPSSPLPVTPAKESAIRAGSFIEAA